MLCIYFYLGIKFKGKKSTKIHLAISNNYIPLSVHITGGNINDTSELNVNWSL
jgi:hypothetical protein